MYEISSVLYVHDQVSNKTGPIPADPFLLSISARLDGTAFLGILVERTRQYRVTLRVAIFGRRPERGWFRRARGQQIGKMGITTEYSVQSIPLCIRLRHEDTRQRYPGLLQRE